MIYFRENRRFSNMQILVSENSAFFGKNDILVLNFPVRFTHCSVPVFPLPKGRLENDYELFSRSFFYELFQFLLTWQMANEDRMLCWSMKKITINEFFVQWMLLYLLFFIFFWIKIFFIFTFENNINKFNLSDK